MFHSNQIFDITCEPDRLADVIDFGIKLYTDNAYIFTRPDGRVNIAVSEPAENLYAIGTGSMEPYKTGPNKGFGHDAPTGWKDMPFEYDPEILARIACQWLDKHEPANPCPGIDGSVHKGFRVMSVRSARELIPPPYEITGWSARPAVLVLTPCWLEYHK